jgi:hypothetical protein
MSLLAIPALFLYGDTWLPYIANPQRLSQSLASTGVFLRPTST